MEILGPQNKKGEASRSFQLGGTPQLNLELSTSSWAQMAWWKGGRAFSQRCISIGENAGAEMLRYLCLTICLRTGHKQSTNAQPKYTFCILCNVSPHESETAFAP